MDDALPVRPVERVGDLDAVAQRLIERQGPFASRACERLALDVFHDQVLDVVLSSDVVQRADVRMGELEIVLASRSKRWRASADGIDFCGQHLDRDGAIQPAISRLVNLAHPALADRREDLVGTESLSRGQSHFTGSVWLSCSYFRQIGSSSASKAANSAEDRTDASSGSA